MTKIILEDMENIEFLTYSIDEVPTIRVYRDSDNLIVQIEKDLRGKVTVEEIITD